MARPDRVGFLVAGVQKGGTTALFDYLSEHPDLCLPACKEAHFFDDETGVDWSAPDYGPYHALFGDGRPGTLRGEATPIYLYWPHSLERIAAYNPAIRLILVFRDPVERAWSHWRMETARGAETESFAWCIREGRDRVTRAPGGVHRVHSYVERGFYGAQLARLFALFAPGQVLCLRSEDLKTHPGRILRQVCDFLHVAPFTSVQPRLSHVGAIETLRQTPSVDDRVHLGRIYADDQILFEQLAKFAVRIQE